MLATTHHALSTGTGRYDIIDTRTGQVVGTASTLRRAMARCDRMNAEYGAVRYVKQYVPC